MEFKAWDFHYYEYYYGSMFCGLAKPIPNVLQYKFEGIEG